MGADRALADGRILCPLQDTPENGARGFDTGAGSGALRLIVHRGGNAVRVFENSCPHEGTPLDAGQLEKALLTADGERLQCASHGAQFRIEDGVCVFGPCVGKALRRVPATIVDGHIVVGRW